MLTILDPRIWLAVMLACGGAYAGGRWQQHNHDAAAYQAERTKAALAASQAQIVAVNAARAEESRRVDAQAAIATQAQKDADNARIDADAAGAAADGLRKRVADLLAAARAAKDSTTAAGSPPAGDPLGVLALVLESADKRAGVLADYADRARTAGLACERAYDSLTVTPAAPDRLPVAVGKP